MDKRTLRTRDAIMKAYFSIIEGKPAGTVSVSEICSVASINRATFYRYYKEPESILSEYSRNLVREIPLSDESDLGATLKASCEAITKNPRKWRQLSRIAGSDYVSSLISREFGKVYESDARAIFAIHGFAGLVAKWLDKQIEGPLEESLEDCIKLLDL